MSCDWDLCLANMLGLQLRHKLVVEVTVQPVSSALPTCLLELSQQEERLTWEKEQHLGWRVFASSEQDYGHTDTVYHMNPTGYTPPS